MTTLTVSRNAEGVAGIRLKGHADYAEAGSDIVCAAISVLATTCANALETVAGVEPETHQDERKAETSIMLPPGISGARLHDAQTVLQTALQGFQDIAAQYPKHLKIINGRNQSC